MFPGLACQDRSRRVPMVGGRNVYGIDLGITDGAVQKIADEAAKSARIGARALKAVYGKIIKPFSELTIKVRQVEEQA